MIALVGIFTTRLNDGIEVIVVSLDDHHLHNSGAIEGSAAALARGVSEVLCDGAVKRFMELKAQKTHGSAVGFQLELKAGEGLWTKRGKEKPINDREHQRNTVGYIHDHGKRGEVVFIHPLAERLLREQEKKKRRRR